MLRQTDFDYVPKHASGLNIIEIARSQANASTAASKSSSRLRIEVAVWEKQRNSARHASPGVSRTKRPTPKWAAHDLGLRLINFARPQTINTSVPMWPRTTQLLGAMPYTLLARNLVIGRSTYWYIRLVAERAKRIEHNTASQGFSSPSFLKRTGTIGASNGWNK